MASSGGLHEYCRSTEVIGLRKTITQTSVMSIEPTVPFKLCRKRFSINIAFAMTLNKDLGQTFKRAKIHHPSSVFPHGQLYMTFSRCSSFDNVAVAVTKEHRQRVEKRQVGDVIYCISRSALKFRIHKKFSVD